MAKDTPPTDAEVKAAQAVLQRAQEATIKEAAVKLQPLSDITAMPEFAALKDKIEALPIELIADMNVGPHLMALRSGLNGLASAAPPPAPEAAPAPAGGTTGGASA